MNQALTELYVASRLQDISRDTRLDAELWLRRRLIWERRLHALRRESGHVE